MLIYNAYHEMTMPEPMLKAILMALEPGGRLVMSEPLHDNVRSATRAEQVKEHEIGPNFVQQELHAGAWTFCRSRVQAMREALAHGREEAGTAVVGRGARREQPYHLEQRHDARRVIGGARRAVQGIQVRADHHDLVGAIAAREVAKNATDATIWSELHVYLQFDPHGVASLRVGEEPTVVLRDPTHRPSRES